MALSRIIAGGLDEGWSDLRELLSQYPMYKLVFVWLLDSDRTDWDLNHTTQQHMPSGMSHSQATLHGWISLTDLP